MMETIKHLREEEMMCLNALAGGGEIWGVPLSMHRPYEQRYVDETIASLQGKGLIDDNRHLTISGKLYIKAFMDYKNGQTHITISDLHIALLHKKHLCAFIQKLADSYVVFYTDTKLVYDLLCMKCMEGREGEAFEIGIRRVRSQEEHYRIRKQQEAYEVYRKDRDHQVHMNQNELERWLADILGMEAAAYGKGQPFIQLF